MIQLLTLTTTPVSIVTLIKFQHGKECKIRAKNMYSLFIVQLINRSKNGTTP